MFCCVCVVCCVVFGVCYNVRRMMCVVWWDGVVYVVCYVVCVVLCVMYDVRCVVCCVTV